MEALAVHHIAPESVAVRGVRLDTLAPDHVLIRTECSAISGGTEAMVYRGRFPVRGPQDSTLTALQGGFTYPFRYGYALVGEVVDVGPGVDADWQGRRVFAFHPHQDHAAVHLNDVVPVPREMAARDAVFLANMESAVTFVLDAAPRIGERVMVLGLGVVGLLTTALLAGFPLALLIGSDPLPDRRERALALGATRAIDPGNSGAWRALEAELFEVQDGPSGLDLALELSGRMHALQHALEMTGFTGRIIVGSWYGSAAHALELGTHFHRRRIELLSSQVSSLHPRLSGRWTRDRRMATALDAVTRLEPQRFITHAFPFRDCQRAFELVSSPREGVLQVILEYR